MSDFLKCACPHCGQSIEYPAEGTGQTVPCPTCEKALVLTPVNPPLKSEPEARRKVRLRTKGRVGNTLLHKAARNGTLNQVPRELLTKETLTIVSKPRYAPEGFYFTGSGYKAKTETVLHIAALYGHGDQIPVEFLTPDLLSIEAGGHAQTVLHYFALSKSLDLIPKIYENSEMWNIKNRQGVTPRELQEAVIARGAYVARVRTEPATEKQKEKLRWFGYVFDEHISKGAASDAIDDCVRKYPEKDRAYYNRPPTEEQLGKISEINKESVRIDGEPYYDFENDGLLTYGRAKDLMQEWGWLERQRERKEEFNKHSNPPSKAQLEWLKELGIKLDSSLKITEWELECIIGLEKLPPREEDLVLFKQHGVISFKGDGFGALLFADLIRSFGGSAQDHNRAKINYGPPCQAALRDPAYHKPTLSRDWEGEIAFTWPKSKIMEWLRA